jgi:hypothetical protein
MPTQRVQLPNKLAGETKFYSFDFTGDLASSETFSTKVVTASVYSGVDASPSSLISGSAVDDNPRVKQLITAGVAGVIYELKCTVTTSLGQTLIRTGFMAIPGELP